MSKLDIEKWTTPGIRAEILKKLESLIKNISMDNKLWFNRAVSVELIADNFGITIKFCSGGHSRIVQISTDEMCNSIKLIHDYAERLTMQLNHLFQIVSSNKAYSSNDQISTKFEL